MQSLASQRSPLTRLSTFKTSISLNCHHCIILKRHLRFLLVKLWYLLTLFWIKTFVLKRCSASKWSSPRFIIPKKVNACAGHWTFGTSTILSFAKSGHFQLFTKIFIVVQAVSILPDLTLPCNTTPLLLSLIVSTSSQSTRPLMSELVPRTWTSLLSLMQTVRQ